MQVIYINCRSFYIGQTITLLWEHIYIHVYAIQNGFLEIPVGKSFAKQHSESMKLTI